MTKDEFAEKLENLVREYNDKLTELVHTAQENEFGEGGWNTDKELPYYDDSKIDDSVCNIIGHGAWVYDRIRGINRKKRRSMQKKIRKVLGYTYP